MIFTSIWAFILLTLSYKILTDYQEKLINPPNTWVKDVRYKPDPISMVVCVPVSYILGELNRTAHEMSLVVLEASTDDAFDQTVNSVYLEVQGKPINVTWQRMQTRVLFSKIRAELSRCFQIIEIKIDEPRYQTFVSPSEIVVNFKHKHYALYLLV